MNYLIPGIKNGFILSPDKKIIKPPFTKIVSLVPSQTELLADLSLNEEVIGITKFCVHPHDWYHNKFRVGGTKKLNIEKVLSVGPDLIIANKEENEQKDIETLAKQTPVYVSDISTLEDSYKMIESIGLLCGKEKAAADLNKKIKTAFHQLEIQKLHSIRSAYFIWKSPWMAVGQNTFIDFIMNKAGFENAFSTERYPIFKLDELKELKPELLILSSEPYPFAEKHKEELQKEFPTTKIILADGEMFSWYGSRLLKTPDYLINLRSEIDPTN